MKRFIKGIAKFALCLTIVFMTLSIGLATKSPSNYVYATAGDVTVDATNFPDAKFRQWVLDNITSGSTTLTAAKIANTTTISVINKQIADLTGIEYFTALTELYCGSNNLSALDVSKNTGLTKLTCENNNLSALDVSKNKALTYLSCYINKLTTLDVSMNTALETLYCYNNQLTTLDVSNNKELKGLYCNNNQLTALNVSNNTKLKALSFFENKLTTLDVSKNTALETLSCSSNQLTVLDVSNNTELITLSCSSNQLTMLDVRKNTALTWLSCATNQLTALDLSQNSASIDARFNGETEQAPVYKAKKVGNKYVVDLKQNDATLNTAKIHSFASNGTYDAATATVTYDSKPAATEKISYAYYTASLNQYTDPLNVNGSVTVEVGSVTNTADSNLVWYYTLLFVVSLIGVSGIVAYTKRKN